MTTPQKTTTKRADRQKGNTPGTWEPGLRRNTAQIAVSTVLVNVLGMAFPVLTLQVYDRIIPAQSVPSLYVMMLGVSVALVLEVVITICRTYLIGWNGATLEHRLACRLMQKYLVAEPGQFGKSSTGTHIQRFGSIGTLKGRYNGETLVTWLDGAFLGLFLGLLAVVGGYLVVVPLVILGIFAVMNLRQVALLKRWLMTRNTFDNRRYNFLIQSLRGVHTIKALCLEDIFMRRYEFMEKQSTLANFAIAGVHGQIFNSVALFSHLMVVGVMSVGAMQVLNGRLSVGVLVACILLSGRLMQPAQKLLQLWVRQQDFAVAEQQVNEVLGVKLQARPDGAVWEAPAKRGELELVQVAIHRDGVPLLEQVNLRVRVGEAVLLDGRDDTPRNALMRVMTGHHRPSAGVVSLDGMATTDYPAHMLALHAGYLAPEGVLFRGSILQNLTRFGRTTEASALGMAEMLGLMEDIGRLPGGLDTPLEGTLTDTLSRDLKQGIVLAAALANNPRVVLFDDAGQGLSPKRMDDLIATLRRIAPHTAMVLVSRDEAVRALATRQAIVYRGTLVEHGGIENPVSLVREGGGDDHSRAA